MVLHSPASCQVEKRTGYPLMMDITRHNEEVQQVWQAYSAGKPLRVPMMLTSVQRIWVLDPALNTQGTTWQEYLNDPQVMFDVTLQHKYYVAHHIPQDAEMGIPAQAWQVGLEFGNVYEESWFGCEIVYPDGQIATTRPRYAGEAKERVFEGGMPGAFEGFMRKVREFHEYAVELARNFEFYGRPVKVGMPVVLGTDGPLTVANGIRGTQLFEDMLEDEEYYHRLMSFVTEAIITRIRAWREYLNLDMRPPCGGFADDAIQFLSLKTYREKVLPYHRRILEALYGAGPHSIHLCGNVQRHFPTLVGELNIHSFDTGFPIHFSSLRDEVGEDVEIQGGVPVADLLNRTPREIEDQTRLVLQSGITRGGRFILKEANDLAPCVPLENLRAMYAACRKYGIYENRSEV
jgi:uroporphyrinogen-III decarboxylase